MGACCAYFGWYLLRRPADVNAASGDLAWMKSELNLTNEQYARIKLIHENSSPRIMALAAQVMKMRIELIAFERTRQTVGQIDFLEFARFVEMRRTVDHECLDSTRRLVQATAKEMNPQQRERYFGLVSPAFMPDLARVF
jgi:hypothetical protein